MIKPYPYQAESAGKLLQSILTYNSAADLSDTGTGKTVVAITVAKCLSLKPYVVCPKVLMHSWKRHFEMMCAEGDVLNYEMVLRDRWGKWKTRKKYLFDWDIPGDAMLIFDEAHRGKSYKSQTCRLMYSAAKVGIPTLFASATLAESPIDMRAVGFALKLHGFEWELFKSWVLANNWGEAYMGGFAPTSRWNPNEFHKLLEDRSSRVRKADLPDMFTENTIQTIEFDVAIPEVTGDFPNALVKYLEERRVAEKAMVETICAYAKELAEEGNRVPIFFNFQESVETAAKLLETPFIHGGVSPTDRKKAHDQFQRNELLYLPVTHASMGIGVDLHDTTGDYPRVPLISPTLNARELLQTLGRTHRSGGKSNVIQKIFFSCNGPDKRIHKKVQKKVNNIETINDGDLNADS